MKRLRNPETAPKGKSTLQRVDNGALEAHEGTQEALDCRGCARGARDPKVKVLCRTRSMRDKRVFEGVGGGGVVAHK